MNDDTALLRRYAEEGSEAAFTELVRRHVDLVYGAALRRTGGDAHRAADVAQQVFTALARQARKLSRHAALCAWLHTATRNAALNLMMSEQRRKARECEAQAIETFAAPGEGNLDWEQVRPVLDTAIDELPEQDRAAVVLRFLERRPFSEIGAALKVSEDAARMRTDRALDKLRSLLARRGITSTAVALGAMVAGHPATSAPAGLAAALASHSLATAGAASAGSVGATLTSLMNTKIITASLLSAVGAFGLGAYVGLMHTFDVPPPPPIETPRHSQTIASLRQANLSLRAEVDRLNATNAKLIAQRAAPSLASSGVAPKTAPEGAALLQLQRAMLNNLRQISAARDQFQLENGRSPVSLDELVGEQKYIKRMLPIDGENYAGLSLLEGQPLVVTTVSGVTVTYTPNQMTRAETTPATARAAELRQKITPAFKNAMAAYSAANNGSVAPNEQALIPYFATPQEGADFVEMLEAQKAARR